MHAFSIFGGPVIAASPSSSFSSSHCRALPPRHSRTSTPVLHYAPVVQTPFSAATASVVAAAAAVLLAAPPAFSENVRIEDVQSPTLKAGLEAAVGGRLEAAERFFQTYLAQEDANSASAYSNLGNVHLQQGKTQLALQDFTKALELAPDAPVPHLNRSIVYEQLGVDEMQASGDRAAAERQWALALEDTAAAIAADPAEFAAWFDQGNVQLRLEDYPGAMKSFSTAADLAPGIAGYRLRAATLAFQTGDPALAKRQMRGLVRKYGNYAEAHAALAAVQWAAGEREEAESQLMAAVDMDWRWENEAAVREATRWPPALYEAYSNLLKIEIKS